MRVGLIVQSSIVFLFVETYEKKTDSTSGGGEVWIPLPFMTLLELKIMQNKHLKHSPNDNQNENEKQEQVWLENIPWKGWVWEKL